MYEPSKVVDDFHLSGFGHWDGIDVFDQLKVGSVLLMKGEPDNPHDPQAVALYFDGVKVGYVPADRNAELSRMLYFGHGDIYLARVSMIDPDAHPDRQIRVRVSIIDNREEDDLQ